MGRPARFFPRFFEYPKRPFFLVLSDLVQDPEPVFGNLPLCQQLNGGLDSFFRADQPLDGPFLGSGEFPLEPFILA